jgi:cytoskeletal protein RodZ
MSTVAQQLHQAREARHLTLQQVAEITKIRSDHLRALEEGDFSVFSAPVYIRGFVRTYSTLLKLDMPQIMSALDAELGQSKKFSEPPPLSDHARGPLDFLMLQLSKIDWRRGGVVLGLLAAALAVLLGGIAWRHYKSADPLKNLKPGVYQSPKSKSGDTLPLPPVKR